MPGEKCLQILLCELYLKLFFFFSFFFWQNIILVVKNIYDENGVCIFNILHCFKRLHCINILRFCEDITDKTVLIKIFNKYKYSQIFQIKVINMGLHKHNFSPARHVFEKMHKIRSFESSFGCILGCTKGCTFDCYDYSKRTLTFVHSLESDMFNKIYLPGPWALSLVHP